jgi:RHS repeat-associated protein
VLVLLAALTGGVKLSAQAAPDVEQGMKPYGSYHGGAIDSVSLTNGNLTLEVGLLDYSQRGGELAYPVVIRYNNKNFSYYQQPCPPGTKLGTTQCPLRMNVVFGPNPLRTSRASQGSSVTIGFDGFAGVGAGNIDTGYSFNGNELFIDPVSVVMPDGSVRQLANTNAGMVNLDGSNFAIPNNGSLTGRNGTLYSTPSAAAQDRNGNQINTASSGGWVDTLGRQIPAAPGPGTPIGTPPPSTASLSSCPALSYSNQPATFAYTWNLPTVGGGTLPLVLCYAAVFVRTGQPQTPPILQVNQSFTMLQSVVFQDNTYWAFEYDAADPNNTSSYAFGDLLKVTFPTGGSITYTWALSNYPCSSGIDRAVQTRTVDANDGTGPHTWSYAPGLVTDPPPLLNDTVHSITTLGGTCSLYETQTQYYQGSHTSGTLLKTVNTDYQYTANPYDPSVIAGAAGDANSVTNVFPIRVTTTMPNGQVSKVETDYDTALTYHGALDGLTYNGGANYACTPPPDMPVCATTTKPVTNYTGSYGKPIAKREYDWGQGAPGALLRQTLTTYKWQVDSSYLTANLMDLPAVVQILDGAGNLCAETDYFYDENIPTRPTPAITTQHVIPSTTVRGNLTTVTRKLSATPCSPNATWTSVSSHTNWFDTGEVQSSTDPLQNVTTHLYDAAYAGAYPTRTQLPDTVTNGVVIHHITNGTYDFNTGLLTSFTDQNSQISNYAYDNRWRMTSAVFPADSNGNHPETDFQYPNLTTVQRLKKQQGATSCLVDASHCIVDYAYFDGVGRTKQTRLVDPAGDDFVDTTYDVAGRVSTVSNPHRSTSSQTDGITTTYYDALGRVTQTTAQDGSISTTDYSNFPTVTVTDPAGKMRRSRIDALGRLVEVREPGPGANTGGSPGTGSINVSGSLYSSTSSGSYATGSVTISGALQTFFVWVCDPVGMQCIRERKTDPGGTVTITVNGHSDQVTYGSSASTIAGNLISTINGDGGAFVSASGPSCADTTDCTISLQARTPGPNYSLSVSAVSNDDADGFASFNDSSASGSALTGGVYPVTTYDSGTVTVTIGSFQAGAPYNQNLNTTASAITNVLITALNASASPVTASLSGSTTILLTARGVGTTTDLTITGSSTASFTASSTTLTNGTNPGGLYTPYVTTYSYDPLGNLLQVNQPGDGSQASRVRTFTYDSFSRLLTATNPESGTICYGVWVNGQCVNGYDADSNLVTKTSPQANQTGAATTTITYCYDALNRILAKQYTNSGATLPACASTPPYLPNPASTYTYDSGTNAIGHISSLTDTAGSGSYTYDPLGRMAGEQRTTNGITKGTGYLYNLDNSLQSATYPGPSFTVSYTYDTAGRPTSVADSAGFTYASAQTADFLPTGAMQQFETGNFNYHFSYNNRLQPTEISAGNSTVTLFDKQYGYNPGNNNGDVVSITNVKDNSRSQTFTYDQLNRLISAWDNGHWGNNYVYDAWGNLLKKSPLAGKPAGENLPGVTADAQNRLHVTPGADYQYDAAGNMTYNASGMYYTFDQENRITAAAGYTYLYDSDGNRVQKTGGGATTTYWYASPGIIAESDSSGNFTNYIFWSGQRLARNISGDIKYYITDHLHSTDMFVDKSGTILDDQDYLPWGGTVSGVGVSNSNNHYKFTGKERDLETGLDYFGARYYSNGLGRFITPDWAPTTPKPSAVPYADWVDPQSLNQYSYVRNVPTTKFDKDGHDPGDKFKSKSAAAADAVKYIRGKSDGYKNEYGTRIEKNGKSYSYKEPVTQGKPGGVDLQPLQKNDVGDVHTHNYGVDDAHANSIEQPDRIGTVQDKDKVQKMQDDPKATVDYQSYVGAPNGDLIQFTPNPNAPDGLGDSKTVQHNVAPDPNPPPPPPPPPTPKKEEPK